MTNELDPQGSSDYQDRFCDLPPVVGYNGTAVATNDSSEQLAKDILDTVTALYRGGLA